MHLHLQKENRKGWECNQIIKKFQINQLKIKKNLKKIKLKRESENK
jgi:hypothetical protein